MRITEETLGEEVGYTLRGLDAKVRDVVRTIQEKKWNDAELPEHAANMRDESVQDGDYLAAYIWARVLHLAENDEG